MRCLSQVMLRALFNTNSISPHYVDPQNVLSKVVLRHGYIYCPSGPLAVKILEVRDGRGLSSHPYLALSSPLYRMALVTFPQVTGSSFMLSLMILSVFPGKVRIVTPCPFHRQGN